MQSIKLDGNDQSRSSEGDDGGGGVGSSSVVAVTGLPKNEEGNSTQSRQEEKNSEVTGAKIGTGQPDQGGESHCAIPICSKDKHKQPNDTEGEFTGDNEGAKGCDHEPPQECGTLPMHAEAQDLGSSHHGGGLVVTSSSSSSLSSSGSGATSGMRANAVSPPPDRKGGDFSPPQPGDDESNPTATQETTDTNVETSVMQPVSAPQPGQRQTGLPPTKPATTATKPKMSEVGRPSTPQASASQTMSFPGGLVEPVMSNPAQKKPIPEQKVVGKNQSPEFGTKRVLPKEQINSFHASPVAPPVVCPVPVSGVPLKQSSILKALSTHQTSNVANRSSQKSPASKSSAGRVPTHVFPAASAASKDKGNARHVSSGTQNIHPMAPAMQAAALAKQPFGQEATPCSRPVSAQPAVTASAGIPPTVSSAAAIMMAVAPTPPAQSKPTTALRRGKWTVEEEAYVARVIQDFNSGFLNAPAGTTLRTYLSEKLHCDPMRITKKFTGDACIGKRVFHPAVRCANNATAIDKAQAELDALERRWRRRLEMQQRESAKKAAASAAAAAAAASGRNHLHAQVAQLPPGGILSASASQQQPVLASNNQQIKQSAVARTASWLDRANAILASNSSLPSSTGTTEPCQQAQVGHSLHQREVEDEMKEVQRLIHEGPIIQQTSAGFPQLLENPTTAYASSSLPQRNNTGAAGSSEGDNPVTFSGVPESSIAGSASLKSASLSNGSSRNKRKVSQDLCTSGSHTPKSLSNPTNAATGMDPSFLPPNGSSKLLQSRHHVGGLNSSEEDTTRPPENLATQLAEDKRTKKSLSTSNLSSIDPQITASGKPASAGAEDAEALVGFLNSVRASAAASSSRRFSG